MATTIILNPAAGHGRSARFREAVLSAARRAWGDADLQLTGAPGHAVELARAAAGSAEISAADASEAPIDRQRARMQGNLQAGLAALGDTSAVPLPRKPACA